MQGKRRDLRKKVVCSKDMRLHLKTIGEQSGIPIEPDEQTELLDFCLNISGVCFACVPGAGGYDAAVVIAERECSLEYLQTTLKSLRNNKELSVFELSPDDDGVSVVYK